MNVAGTWRKVLEESLCVISNLELEEGFAVIHRRMKNEESFEDLKSLLCIDKVMNKH